MTVVAIDGPAGAGKSTVARAVARALGFRYLDTGAMYRAVALAALEGGLSLEDAEVLGEVARSVDVDVDETRVLLDGKVVTERIRAADVTEAVSRVSAHPSVRTALVDQQRVMAGRADVVVEGRDIGTIVFPDAEVKVYLTASLDERARRRCEELGMPCDDATLSDIKVSIASRDDADSGRANSPLRRPADAVELDTTDLSLHEVVEAVVQLTKRADRDD